IHQNDRFFRQGKSGSDVFHLCPVGGFPNDQSGIVQNALLFGMAKTDFVDQEVHHGFSHLRNGLGNRRQSRISGPGENGIVEADEDSWSGILIPFSWAPNITPIASWSLQAKIAVGGSGNRNKRSKALMPLAMVPRVLTRYSSLGRMP